MKKYPTTTQRSPQGIDSDFTPPSYEEQYSSFKEALSNPHYRFMSRFTYSTKPKQFLISHLLLSDSTARLAAVLDSFPENINVLAHLLSVVSEAGSIDGLCLVEAKLKALITDSNQLKVKELLQQAASAKSELEAIDQQINDFKMVPTKDETRASEPAVLIAARRGHFDSLRHLINPDADLNITNCYGQNVFDVLLEQLQRFKSSEVDKLKPYIRCLALLLCENIPIKKDTAKTIGENYKKPLFYSLQNNLMVNGGGV